MLFHGESFSAPTVSSRTALDAELLMYGLHALQYPDLHPAWVYMEPNGVTGPQGHLMQTESYDLHASHDPKRLANILYPRFMAVGKVVLAEADGVDPVGDFSLFCALSTRLDRGLHELLDLHRRVPGKEHANVVTMLTDTLPPADVVGAVLDEVSRAKRVSSALMKYLADIT